ncbi:hypothetical protein [Camelimonas lactis]|uniref:Uncharacterized protein n=1 Tax=Camelimonas lactis TaxID=659006 RepID=A0A4R2GU87_9HYPH|nr:hypothetical protein [Camelimonas lactis]TCO14232.1 hypothetical protein EV666_104185 [Camelimonas lactis]
MSSSTSSSDSATPSRDARRWRRFAWTFALALAVLLAGLTGGLVLLDPYDTGRFTLLSARGVAEGPPWQVNASRARDQRFDSVVVGNSRMQMLEPERLDRLTGRRFVNLSVLRSGPLEEQPVFETFLRHHRAPRAAVIGVDELWCRPQQKRGSQFPYWLYSASNQEYLHGLVRYQAVEQMMRRLSALYGGAEMARPDGYWDYTTVYLGKTGAQAKQDAMKSSASRPVDTDNPDRVFPAMTILGDMLAALPASTQTVLAWPPTHINFQPQPHSLAEAVLNQCKAQIRDIASRHPNVTFLDWGGDRPVNRDPANFHDEIHFRKNLAGQFADAIGAVLAAKLTR